LVEVGELLIAVLAGLSSVSLVWWPERRGKPAIGRVAGRLAPAVVTVVSGWGGWVR
jgi:hypothetical protein